MEEPNNDESSQSAGSQGAGQPSTTRADTETSVATDQDAGRPSLDPYTAPGNASRNDLQFTAPLEQDTGVDIRSADPTKANAGTAAATGQAQEPAADVGGSGSGAPDEGADATLHNDVQMLAGPQDGAEASASGGGGAEPAASELQTAGGAAAGLQSGSRPVSAVAGLSVHQATDMQDSQAEAVNRAVAGEASVTSAIATGTAGPAAASEASSASDSGAVGASSVFDANDEAGAEASDYQTPDVTLQSQPAALELHDSGGTGDGVGVAATEDEAAQGGTLGEEALEADGHSGGGLHAGGAVKVTSSPPPSAYPQARAVRSAAAAAAPVLKSSPPLAVKAAPAPVPALPKHLTFYSWWYEDAESADVALRVSCDSEVGGGLTRRYVRVVFHTASHEFSIISESGEQALQMHRVLAVVSSAGGSVDQWDLHVGARLGIMGRPIALMKADIETSLWHEQHARRLRTLREALIAELLKYKPAATSNAIKFERGAKGAAAGLSLRFTARQLDGMVADLNKYRPSRAAWYTSQLECYR